MCRPLKVLLIYLGVIVGVIILALGAVLAYSLTRGGLPREEPAPRASELNTQVYEALHAWGISEAVVDITSERALVRYNLPPGAEEKAIWALVFTALYSLSPNTEWVVLQMYRDFEPQTEVTVLMSDVVAFLEARLTPEEFEQRLRVRPLR